MAEKTKRTKKATPKTSTKPKAAAKKKTKKNPVYFCKKNIATFEDVDAFCGNCKSIKSGYASLEACQNMNLVITKQ